MKVVTVITHSDRYFDSLVDSAKKIFFIKNSYQFFIL